MLHRLFARRHGPGGNRLSDNQKGGAQASDDLQAKASRTGGLAANQFLISGLTSPSWTSHSYASIAAAGYSSNPVVHRCVRLIAETASSVPLLLYEHDRELTEHPFLKLLMRPSPLQDGASFLETALSHLLLSGNAYLECVEFDGEPAELYALRPDRMRVLAGSHGWPEAYEYSVNGQKVIFQQRGEDIATPPILHLTLFNPLDDHYGLSPLQAAISALDTHNAAAKWNKALLDNAARPSGALVYVDTNGSNLTNDQFDRLKSELNERFSGAENAGRPLLLEGGLDWKPMGLSPKEMDFVEAKNTAAREVALAFGVPPMMLGVPGDATYANYAEANRAFWRLTVLPLLKRFTRAVEGWLGPAYGDGLRLGHDLDAVEALAVEREKLWSRLEAASFLTEAEKRQAVGYSARPDE